MATDRHEAARRGQQRKAATKHPFVMLDHRILDSEPFADMRPSSQILLVLMNRQFNGRNNGHISASFGWAKRYGFGSDNTLKAAVTELRDHGFAFKTRSHGANGQWAKYALTWLPLSQDRKGLFLHDFKANAWRDWKPSEEKSSGQKLRPITRRNCDFTYEFPSETAGTLPSKTDPYVDLPSTEFKSATADAEGPPTGYGQWVTGYLARLAAHGPQFIAANSVSDPRLIGVAA